MPTYLNCPNCHLSIELRGQRPLLEECPRCLARLGRVAPLFRSSLPWRMLGAPIEEAGRRRPGGRVRP